MAAQMADVMAPRAAEPPPEVTVLCDSGPRTYCQKTVKATLNALAADILAGGIPRNTPTTAKIKSKVWTGTLEEFAPRYNQLAKLYWPVRTYSRIGLAYGLLFAGCLSVYISLRVSWETTQTVATAASLVAALAVCWVANKLRLGPVVGTTGFGISVFLFVNWFLCVDTSPQRFLLSFITLVGILSSFGMAFGGIVGTLRRPHLRRAYDAQNERVVWRIGIPTVIWLVLCFFSLWATMEQVERHAYDSDDQSAALFMNGVRPLPSKLASIASRARWSSGAVENSWRRDASDASYICFSCSGPITSSARTDYIGISGTTLRENETTLRENSPITSARNHISCSNRPHRPQYVAASAILAVNWRALVYDRQPRSCAIIHESRVLSGMS
jgi:hypothetical protein